MTGYTAHTPKYVEPKSELDAQFTVLADSLLRAIITRRLVEHPQYSGA